MRVAAGKQACSWALTYILFILEVSCLVRAWEQEVQEGQGLPRCALWEEAFSLNQRTVTAPLPPNLRGKWVSESCEVRSGPEYVLRRYHFFLNQSFVLQQFYYQDESCALPSYSLTAAGRLHPAHPSWVVPGATEADFVLTRVTLTPYGKTSAQALARRVNSTCPGLVRRPWRSLKKYKVYTWTEREDSLNQVEVRQDLDCLSGLDWSASELQLIRLEHRKAFHHKHRPTGIRTELYLGNLHTDKTKRGLYRPTAYLAPLKRAEDSSCAVCHIISKSNELSPPQLPARAQLPVYLPGEWLSTHCEVRNMGLFLTRRFRFLSDGSWNALYRYHRDPNCQWAMFSLDVWGTWLPGDPSSVLQGATEYDFHVDTASLTPHDEAFVANLNGFEENMCGPPNSWRPNVTQDVTSTGGCVGLGLAVPRTEYDVVRMEVDHFGNSLLYLGTPDTESRPSSAHRRPTSYQPPLIQCSYGDEINMIHPLALKQDPASGASRNLWSLAALASITSVLLQLL